MAKADPPQNPPCPGCRAALLPTARWCEACGQDARWVRRGGPSPRRIPRALDVTHFQAPGDRAATRALGMAAPVQALVRYYLRRVAEPEYRSQLLGNAVRVSATQVPRVHRLARYCERVLHTAPIEVYVSTSAEAKAYTFGSGQTDVVVLTSALIDFVPDDDEFLFYFGRQIGHVKADHVVYLTVAKALGTALKGIPALGNALSSAAAFLLVPWERIATLTADRAGLLCCQNLLTASRALVKGELGFGGSMAGVGMDEFLGQARELERNRDWGDTWKNKPALARRVRALEAYYDGSEWARVFEGAWDPLAPWFACWYCPGGGAPEGVEARLDALVCGDCGRDLKIDEVPCPTCCGPVPVAAGASLATLACPACQAPWLPEALRPRFRGPEPPGLAELSAYRKLGVHPAATPARLRRAFRERLAPLEGRVAGLPGPDPVSQKIRLYAAFKTLIDPLRRAQHDRQLAHARALLAQGQGAARPVPRCGACGALAQGRFCGICGTAREGKAGAGSGPLEELAGALRELAQTDVGELLEAPGAPFALAFHSDRQALFFGSWPDLERPGEVQGLLRAATDMLASTRPAVTPRFHGVVPGALDAELVSRLAAQRPRATSSRPWSLHLVRAGVGGGLEVLTPERGGLASIRFPDARAYLRACLGIAAPEA